MGELIKVHRIGAEPVELPREQVWLTERTRWLTGLACQQKRQWGYHWGGIGISSARPSEDLILGRAVHAGLEWMLDQARYDCEGGVSNESHCAELASTGARLAFEQMKLESEAGITIQDNESYGDDSPELAQLLIEEQANLAYALVWAFGRKRLAGLLERYEVVAVEPEINWLVGEIWNPGCPLISIVMMSRPDAVLRSRGDGKLRTVSWKTAQRFQMGTLEELEIHSQTMTEGLAVEAMYGEPSVGTFFGYFIKSAKSFDASIGMKRYQSGLIRPYMAYGGIGELGPANFKVTGEWPDPDDPSRNKRISKGWYRRDVWQEMTMPEWLEMLDSGEVQPEAGKRDWLAEAVVEPMEQPFVRSYGERLVQQIIQTEKDWMEVVSGERRAAMNEGECYNKYSKRCPHYMLCWRGETVEKQLAGGLRVLRTPNHPAEVSNETN